MHSFEEVVEHFGGITPLAKRLGCTSQAISQWNGEFPEGRAFQIEVLSEGRFKADRLPIRKSNRKSH